MRSDPRDLLKPGNAVAIPSSNAGGGKGPIANGYFWAALHLCETLSKNRGPVDTAVYPAFFLFRHGLELVFKELIAGFGEELSPGAKLPYGHVLASLWSKLAPHMKLWADEIKYQL